MWHSTEVPSVVEFACLGERSIVARASQEAPAGGAGGSAQKRNSDTKDSTLRALTVRQIYEAAQQTMDDQLTVDGKPVINITIVGKIVHVEEQQLMTLYTVDDGTGRVLAKYWTPNDDDDYDRQRRAEYRVGVYVRVHGHVSSVGREKSMVAFNIRLISDHNEVTYHYLQCIFQHLHLTRGSGAGAGTAGGFPVAAQQPGGAAPGAYNAPMHAQPAAGGYNPNPGVNPLQESILRIMSGPEGLTEHGIDVNNVVNLLGGRYNLGQVREALQFLSDEGLVYPTIDDQHYKSTAV
ncbi:hypothetical protein N2152v2_007685 [Parachlorella kessleri]